MGLGRLCRLFIALRGRVFGGVAFVVKQAADCKQEYAQCNGCAGPVAAQPRFGMKQPQDSRSDDGQMACRFTRTYRAVADLVMAAVIAIDPLAQPCQLSHVGVL